jgi:hypothetical protein
MPLKKFPDLADIELDHLGEVSLREAYRLLRQHHIEETSVLYTRLTDLRTELKEIKTMGQRHFNGHEVAFLLGIDEDGSKDRTVASTNQGVNSSGYEVETKVVKHPDGKFYEFAYESNREHGIVACLEHPNDLIEAHEVVAEEIKIVKYVRKA